MRLNSIAGDIQITTSSYSAPVPPVLSFFTHTRSVVPSDSAFSASSVLVPPVVAALGPSDQMTATALEVSVVAAEAQPVALDPVAVVHTLNIVVAMIVPIVAVRMPLVFVNRFAAVVL